MQYFSNKQIRQMIKDAENVEDIVDILGMFHNIVNDGKLEEWKDTEETMECYNEFISFKLSESLSDLYDTLIPIIGKDWRQITLDELNLFEDRVMHIPANEENSATFILGLINTNNKNQSGLNFQMLLVVEEENDEDKISETIAYDLEKAKAFLNFVFFW